MCLRADLWNGLVTVTALWQTWQGWPSLRKIHANSAASKCNCRRAKRLLITELFFFYRMKGESKGTLVLHESHGLWTICPFITLLSSLFALFLTNWLELLLRSLIAFPPSPPTPLLCCSLILSGSCWDRGEIPWNDYKRKPERRCPSSARGPWGIKTRFEWRACVRILSGLPTKLKTLTSPTGRQN